MPLALYMKGFHSGLGQEQKSASASQSAEHFPKFSETPEVSSLLAIRDICLYHRAFPIRRPVRLSPQVSPVFPIKPGFEYLRSVAKR
jgi:hypothetical protein